MASSAYIERTSGCVYEFGPFYCWEDERLLSRNGESVQLTPKVFDTLLLLVKNAGHLIEKDELMKAMWPDSFVEEVNLNRAISTLRRALGDTANEPSFIETVPKRGYRFIAPVVIKDVAEVGSRVRALRDSKTGFAELPTPASPPAQAPKVISPVSVATGMQKRPGHLLPTSIVVITLLIATAAIALFWYLSHKAESGHASVTPALTSLAVLPFKTLSPDSRNDDAGLGITDVLITRLSNIREVIVRPTSAVLKYKGEDQDAVDAGKALKVDAVLEGSVQRVDERIRVTVRLMDVNRGVQLFGGSYTEPATDMLKVQDSIADRVAKALSMELISSPGLTHNLKAHDLYSKGRVLFNRRDYPSVKAAEMSFRQAVEEDPDFALAYVGIADTLAMQNTFFETESLQKQALSLEPNLAEAYASIGFCKMYYTWEWEEAEQNLKRAIELKPGYVSSYLWYGNLLEITGRLDEARDMFKRGLEIDPFSYNLLADLGQAYYFSKEYDKTVELCQKALEIEPGFLFAETYLEAVHRIRGEYDKLAETSQLQRYGGAKGYQQYNIDKFKRFREKEAFYLVAMWSALSGEEAQAIEYLEKSYEHHLFLLPYMGADPIFEKLHSQPRYQELLRKIKLTGWVGR